MASHGNANGCIAAPGRGRSPAAAACFRARDPDALGGRVLRQNAAVCCNHASRRTERAARQATEDVLPHQPGSRSNRSCRAGTKKRTLLLARRRDSGDAVLRYTGRQRRN